MFGDGFTEFANGMKYRIRRRPLPIQLLVAGNIAMVWLGLPD
jgi:hypothetical protein